LNIICWRNRSPNHYIKSGNIPLALYCWKDPFIPCLKTGSYSTTKQRLSPWKEQMIVIFWRRFDKTSG
jgi:hypothetical protein